MLLHVAIIVTMEGHPAQQEVGSGQRQIGGPAGRLRAQECEGSLRGRLRGVVLVLAQMHVGPAQGQGRTDTTRQPLAFRLAGIEGRDGTGALPPARPGLAFFAPQLGAAGRLRLLLPRPREIRLGLRIRAQEHPQIAQLLA